MKRNLIVSTLSAMVAALFLTGLAHGQSGPTTTVPAVTPAPVAAQPAATLSEQALEATIKTLDPSYRVKPSADGKGKIYNFKVVKDGWGYELMFEAYPDYVWINATLSPVISAPQNIPANLMAELLKANFNVGPAHFAFGTVTNPNGFRLNLCRMLDRRMTIETFNGYVTGFLKVVRDTYPTWSQVR